VPGSPCAGERLTVVRCGPSRAGATQGTIRGCPCRLRWRD